MSFIIKWLDSGREPQCPPDPGFPDGVVVRSGAKKFCRVELPYPARRCGFYWVQCTICHASMLLTTTGRPDDPKTVELPCK